MRCILFLLFFVIGSPVFAGGGSAPAKVKSIEKISDNVSLVEFEWVKEKGFIASNYETKLRFQYQQWPNQSWFSKLVAIFYNYLEKKYPKEKFDQCLSFLHEKSRTKEVFNLGQMGTAEFVKDKENIDQIIIPYAELWTQKDGEPVCLLYANPI